MMVKKAIFPVGGLGTRFLPATKALPKEMLPIVDKPLIQYAVEEAIEAGIEEFIFVTGRNKTAIEDHFDHSVELESVLAQKGKDSALQTVRDMMRVPGSVAYVLLALVAVKWARTNAMRVFALIGAIAWLVLTGKVAISKAPLF